MRAKAALATCAAGALMFGAAPSYAQQTVEAPGSSTLAEPVVPPGARQGTTIGGATEAWNPAWQYKVGIYDAFIIGGAVTTAIGASILEPSPSETARRRGLAFDEDVRDVLRADSPVYRYHIRDASDLGVSLLTTWPILIDGLVTAWWYRGNSTVARNLAIVNAEVIAVSAAMQQVATTLASRERPFARNCGTEQYRDSADCENQVRSRSFFSGHSSQAFANASNLCVNHLGMKLLGTTGDVLTCATAVAVATSVGMFRIVGDMHYASDVMTGAAVGTIVGVTLPLLHGRRVNDAQDARPPKLEMRLVPMGSGLGLRGSF